MQSFSNFTNSVSIILPYLSLLTVNYELSIQRAKAISEVIDEIFLKNNLKFNILISKTYNYDLQWTLAEILKNSSEKYEIRVFNSLPENEKLSTLFLFNDYSELSIAEDYIKLMTTNYSTAYKYVIYCADLNDENVYMHCRPYFMLDRRNWIDYIDKYYVVSTTHGFLLMTYIVRKNQLQVNTFNLKLEVINGYFFQIKKWAAFKSLLLKTSEVENYALAVTVYTDLKYEFYIDKLTQQQFGVLVDIFNIIGQRAKFRPIFTNHFKKSLFVMRKNNDGFLILFVSSCYSLKNTKRDYHVTTTYTEENFRLIITPPESLTSCEKILMPFDTITWILLFLTFLTAFIVIKIVHKQSKTIQNIIYGAKVHAPAYNVVGISFGIPQPSLPKNNFARIILVCFIFFCLIFRTAYIGVLFELLALNIQKQSPQTLLELMNKNFTLIREKIFLYGEIETTLQKIISFGITEYSVNYHKWKLYRSVVPEEDIPKAFSFEDISIGFILWIITCYFAFLCFVCEVLWVKFKIHGKEMLGLILLFILIYQRLKKIY